MLGVLVNGAGIVAGAVLGVLMRRWISREVTEHLAVALGVCTIVIGVKIAIRFENVMVLLGSLIAGGILGKLLAVEANVEKFAAVVERKLVRNFDGNFVKGMTLCSILFCTGAMSVVGAINSGVWGDHEILYMKTVLDAVYSFAMATIYGIGVAFSCIAVVLYEGAIALFAGHLTILTTEAATAEISGVGGVLIVMIGLSITGIKRIPVGDFLPAILVAIVALALS